MKSFFVRVFGGYLLVVVAALGAVLWLGLSAVQRHQMRTLEEGLRREAAVLTELARPLLVTGRSARADSLFDALSERTGTRITVIDTMGRVLADTEAEPDSMENHRERPEVIGARMSGYGSAVRFSRSVGRNTLYYALPVFAPSDTSENLHVGYVRTASDMGQVNAALADLTVRVLLSALIVLVFAVGAALLYSADLARPVRALVRAFRRLGAGEFGLRVDHSGTDELGELCRTFNETAARLEVLARTQRGQAETFEAIINSIPEGLVVLDTAGRVKTANASFIRIAGDPDVVGRHHWEITREFRLGEFLHSVGAAPPAQSAEVEVAGRTYVCTASLVEPTRDMVITLHDITELRAATRLKRELVAAASHELRTPLTAIQGYVETLEGEVSEEGRRYLEIVRRHTERLVRIVGDLVQLSELEEPGFKLELEPVNLAQLAEEEAALVRPRCEQKGVALVLSAAGPVEVKADRFRLQQVITNLLDNALRHTEKGSIQLVVTRAEDKAVIQVRDTGAGIPAEHIPRIFERFYVVDRARSRKVGGTGLGLAIVRHVVELHGGRVEVESAPGRGTTFTVLLPIRGA